MGGCHFKLRKEAGTLVVEVLLTHVVEVLPKGLHPAVRLLAALRREGVRDLLAAVLVADADVLDFALRVFLRRSYPGLLTCETMATGRTRLGLSLRTCSYERITKFLHAIVPECIQRGVLFD